VCRVIPVNCRIIADIQNYSSSSSCYCSHLPVISVPDYYRDLFLMDARIYPAWLERKKWYLQVVIMCIYTPGFDLKETFQYKSNICSWTPLHNTFTSPDSKLPGWAVPDEIGFVWNWLHLIMASPAELFPPGTDSTLNYSRSRNYSQVMFHITLEHLYIASTYS